MNPRLFQQIASKLNRDSRRHNGVTAEQVANVASGTERTISHPVIAQIRTELKCATNKIPITKRPKKNEPHYLWEE